MPRIRWRLAAATGEQLCDVSRIERVTLVAELAINHHRAALLGHQVLGIFQPKADQGITRALTRAAAAKAQGIGLEQAQGLFVIQAVQHLWTLCPEVLFLFQQIDSAKIRIYSTIFKFYIIHE